MDEKFTKGEWKHISDTHEFCDTGDYQTDEIIKVDKKCIAQCFSIGSISEEEAEANAKLIAAAPELLEACQLMKMYIDYKCKEDANKDLNLENIQKLINKALGE